MRSKLLALGGLFLSLGQRFELCVKGFILIIAIKFLGHSPELFKLRLILFRLLLLWHLKTRLPLI